MEELDWNCFYFSCGESRFSLMLDDFVYARAQNWDCAQEKKPYGEFLYQLLMDFRSKALDRSKFIKKFMSNFYEWIKTFSEVRALIDFSSDCFRVLPVTYRKEQPFLKSFFLSRPQNLKFFPFSLFFGKEFKIHVGLGSLKKAIILRFFLSLTLSTHLDIRLRFCDLFRIAQHFLLYAISKLRLTFLPFLSCRVSLSYLTFLSSFFRFRFQCDLRDIRVNGPWYYFTFLDPNFSKFEGAHSISFSQKEFIRFILDSSLKMLTNGLFACNAFRKSFLCNN